MNEYIEAERSNRFRAAQMKRRAQKSIRPYIQQAFRTEALRRHEKRSELWVTWVEQNHRRDLDNIAFATKFIQDELVECGVFPDDNTNYIALLHHTVAYDRKHPRIIIEIRER